MKIIERTDKSLNWLGRWMENNGKYSGWGGSSLQFKFTGSSLSIEVDVHNSGGISVMIDDYSDNWTHKLTPTHNGLNTITISSELENKEHTAFFRFWSTNYKNKRSGTDYIKVNNILIDDNAVINKWSGDVKLGYFGDSWASADNDCLRFIGLDSVEIHSISDPGFTSSNGLNMYPYVAGTIPIKDISFDAVVIGYGINDANRRFLSSNYIFKKNIIKLIDNIRANDPIVKIFLLQSPRNYSSKKDASKYGSVLEDISKKRRDCIYISSKDTENQLGWSVDGVHLDTKGKHIYGKWLGEQLSYYL